jgi:hypothetical protein
MPINLFRWDSKKVVVAVAIMISLGLVLAFFYVNFPRNYHFKESSLPDFPTESEIPDNGYCLGCDQLYGYINYRGDLAIKPQYVHAFDFQNGLASVWTKDNRLFINKKGEVVLDFLKVITSFANDSISIKWAKDYIRKGSYFFNNISEGKVAFPFKDQYGFVDTTGKIIIQPKFEFANDFREGLAVVYLNGKYGYINKTGSIVIPCQFDQASSFSEGLAGVCVNKKWGFINRIGRIVIQLQYVQHTDCCEHVSTPYYFFQDSTCIVLQHNLYFLINHQGKIIDTIHDKSTIFRFEYPLFSFYDSIKGAGFTDNKGNIIIKPQFSSTENFFSEGLCYAAPKQSKKYGYIDTTGKFVIQPKYTFPGSFGNGLAVVGLGDIDHMDRQIIDMKGNVVSDNKWLRSATRFEQFKDSMAVIGFRDKVWARIKNKIP